MSSTTAATNARSLSMRPLVPFFMPGSLDRNDALVAEPTSCLGPPTTIAVRKWDRATGVFNDPQLVEMTQAPQPTLVAAPKLSPAPAKQKTAATISLLTPAAIAARRRQQAAKSDSGGASNLCGRTPPPKNEIVDLLRRRELPASPLVKRPECNALPTRVNVTAKPEPAKPANTRRRRYSQPLLRADVQNINYNASSRTQSYYEPPTFDLSKRNPPQVATKPVARQTVKQVPKTDATNCTTRKTRPKPTVKQEVPSLRDDEQEPITPDQRSASPSPQVSSISSNCTTPDAKEQCANSLSPPSGRKSIPVPQRSPLGVKYAGMSFEAASPSPVSIPTPRLAGRRHSTAGAGHAKASLFENSADGVDVIKRGLARCGDGKVDEELKSCEQVA